MTARLYFLGIGGTLMGGLALIAKAKGHHVSGSDGAIYPPMGDQLAAAGITVYEGFDAAQLRPPPDLVVIGNAQLPRGHPAIEHILDENLPYISGAEWLGTAVLRERWVLAVAGTHGKTTTASMLAAILECAGHAPGFMIGGVPRAFGTSARLGKPPFFVVEADEYDTSYFDRRSKFVHYRPRTLVINNLEYDHADIFTSLRAIQTQFHHLMRTVPSTGRVVAPTRDPAVDQVLRRGCWTPVVRFGAGRPPRRPFARDAGEQWLAANVEADGSAFDVRRNGSGCGRVAWPLTGEHNVANALAAIAAAHHAGVPAATAVRALSAFRGVKRRLELIAQRGALKVYDDFAHHPTAIRTTLEGLRRHVGDEQVIAVVEPRTHTMSLGALRTELATCCRAANEAIWFRGPNLKWDLAEVLRASVVPATVVDDVERIVNRLTRPRRRPCHVVIMSNGGFHGIREKFIARLGG